MNLAERRCKGARVPVSRGRVYGVGQFALAHDKVAANMSTIGAPYNVKGHDMQHKETLEGLLTQLHERLASTDTSAEQDALLAQLQAQLSEWDGPKPADGSVVTTAEMLLDTLRERHPQLSAVLREMLDTLGRIGI